MVTAKDILQGIVTVVIGVTVSVALGMLTYGVIPSVLLAGLLHFEILSRGLVEALFIWTVLGCTVLGLVTVAFFAQFFDGATER